MAPQAPAPKGPSTPSSTSSDNKPKRARTSKPKVKTGCNNCKQRRIKCDEKRPSCTQCVRSKKICTGYPPPARSAWPYEEIRIAPKPMQAAPAPLAASVKQTPQRRVHKEYVRRNTPPQTPVTPQSAAVVLYHPSASLSFNHQEGLYFQLFRSHTANELSGFFDNVFWSQTVLQECHSDSAIRHAVVALGALYKTLEKSSESPPGSPSEVMDPVDNAVSHWRVALEQYMGALQALCTPGPEDAQDAADG